MVNMRCVMTLKSTDGAGTGVSVGVSTAVGVGGGGGVLAGTGVSVGFTVGVSVGFSVGVGTRVLVAVLVGMGVPVGVLVAVAVTGGRGVLVGVGVIPAMAWQPVIARAKKAHQITLRVFRSKSFICFSPSVVLIRVRLKQPGVEASAGFLPPEGSTPQAILAKLF